MVIKTQWNINNVFLISPRIKKKKNKKSPETIALQEESVCHRGGAQTLITQHR